MQTFHVPTSSVSGVEGLVLLDGEHSQLGKVSGGDLLGLVDEAIGRMALGGDVELHVGLAGGEPYLADEDVGYGDWGLAFAAGDGHLKRAAGLEVEEADGPLAGGVGDCGFGGAVEGDGDLFAGIGCAPDGHGHAGLQHHVVAEEGVGLDLCVCR